MVMLRVKICGNRTAEEVALAVACGADAVGLIVGARYVSEDSLEPAEAAGLLAALPPLVHSALVTHLTTAEQVLAIHAAVPTSVIQLHGEIERSEIAGIRERLPGVPLIKAVHVVDASSVEAAKAFEGAVDALHLDSRSEDRIGGTGHVHDWRISRRIVEAAEVPVILAGGLTPENVRDAIREVRPYAVDVNSGVEHPDGSKDPEKVRGFVRLAKCG